MNCNVIDFAEVDWKYLDQFVDRTVFQTREWLSFLAETQHAQPLVLELRENGSLMGYFSGLTFRKFGIKILGSSFPGWTTPYMGFNLLPGASRSAALSAVRDFAFRHIGCHYLEISDPYFTSDDGQAQDLPTSYFKSYRTCLTDSEPEILKRMSKSCRWSIRTAEKKGVKFEEAHDLEFADEYYQQLIDVFAKQHLVPTYSVDRIRALIRHLEPTGRLLLVRARDPQGKCIATGIFVGYNKIAEFWGNASFRAGQSFQPNEAMQWFAIRHWKNRGMEMYDWGGENPYKEKYGGVPFAVPRFTVARYKLLISFRDGAQKLFRGQQRLRGWLQGKKNRTAPPLEREPAHEAQ